MKLTQKGFSLVDGIISMGILALVGTGVLLLTDSQNKAVNKSANNLSRSLTVVREMMTDPATCTLNFFDKNVDSNVEMQELKSFDGAVVLAPGQSMDGGRFKVNKITIGAYNATTMRTNIIFDLSRMEKGKPGESIRKIMPLFTEITNGKISRCMSSGGQGMITLLKELCKDADPKNVGNCEQNFNNVLDEVKEIYCNSSAFTQYNPVSKKCQPIDANKSCGSYFIHGYNADGSLDCHLPVSDLAPAPPVGTCTNWGDWVPDLTTVCSQQTVTQTKSCLDAGSTVPPQTQPNMTGTAACCSTIATWDDIPKPGGSCSCSGQVAGVPFVTTGTTVDLEYTDAVNTCAGFYTGVCQADGTLQVVSANCHGNPNATVN